MAAPNSAIAKAVSPGREKSFAAWGEVAMKAAPTKHRPPTVKQRNRRNQTQAVAKSLSTREGGFARSLVPKYQGIAQSTVAARKISSVPRLAPPFAKAAAASIRRNVRYVAVLMRLTPHSAACPLQCFVSH